MTARGRVTTVVAAAAVGAVVLTVGLTVLGNDDEEQPDVRSGSPPLALDLGVRTDPEATALRRGQRLYSQGKEQAAVREFARYSSPQAEIGEAFAAWPDGGAIARVERLGAEHPRSAVVQLHLGLARFWVGRMSAAFSAWRTAVREEPDSASAVRAGDLLHPNSPRGLPFFVPGFALPKGLRTLAPPVQFRRLERAARAGDARDKLLYGLALQRLGRPVSAEREFAAAAALAPDDPEAQVAAAVGRYRKDSPARAFSRLGPLARKFPRATTVRFHLGLLLLWLGRVEDARRHLQHAQRLEPGSALARESSRLLARLQNVGDE